MTKVRKNQSISVLGVPLDHGAGRRGVGMGPSAIRIAGLHQKLLALGLSIRDLGDIAIPIPEVASIGDPKLKYLPIVSQACDLLAKEVKGILDGGSFPLVLGGDHSMAMGTISGIAGHLGEGAEDDAGRPKMGVLWFDAHGDLNTPESSPSGNIHGMPVASLLGDGPPELTNFSFPGRKLHPSRIVQIGLRDLDEQEAKLIHASEIHAFTMADIDRKGMARVMEEAIEIATDGVDHLHVDFDIDVLDPRIAPGTGTRVMGGLTYREAHLGLEMIAERNIIRSMELVEVNPTLDDGNSTAEIAVGLIASALGEKIL